MNEPNYKPHKFASMLPPMTAEQLDELTENIKANGLLERIVTHDGQILDGVHRKIACKRAKVEPSYVKFADLVQFGAVKNPDPLQFVISRHTRRDMTWEQRKKWALELVPLLAERAKERQLAGAAAPTDAKGKAAAQAAAVTGLSTRTVERELRKQREAESGDNEEAEPKPERSEQLREIVSILRKAKSLIVGFKGNATPDDIEQLEKFLNVLHIAVNKLCAPDKSQPLTDDSVMSFGKYKGKRLSQIDTGYYRWWLNKNPDHDAIESAAVIARYPEKAVLNQKLKFHAYATERVERDNTQ